MAASLLRFQRNTVRWRCGHVPINVVFMTTRYLLAIDQGTTGTTALILALAPGAQLRILAVGQVEFAQHFVRPGWVEHHLDEIWASVAAAVSQALDRANLKATDLSSVSITNQRETCCLWDRATGAALGPAIVWQDRRTADRIETLRQAGHAEKVRGKTGLVLDAYFSATKLAWMLDQNPALRARARAKALCGGTIDTWLVWRLTRGQSFVTDLTNASRTLLYNVRERCWDPELLALMGDIPEELMAEVRASDAQMGETSGVGFLPDGLPIVGMAGDQNASLFGCGCLSPGRAKCTYGTGAFLLINTGTRFLTGADHGLLATPAWQLGDETTYALEGSIFVAGALITWLRDGLGLIGGPDEVEALARTVSSSEGVILVPALTGLGAPHWRPEARGVMAGITRGTQPGHIARAALEGIAWQVYDLTRAFVCSLGEPLTRFVADGGVSSNNLLMQFQADILQCEVSRPAMRENTALGAALLGAFGMGWITQSELEAREQDEHESFVPSMSREAVREREQLWATWVTRS